MSKNNQPQSKRQFRDGISQKPKYVGEFKDDKRNGKGTMTYSNGEKKSGLWQDNKFVGQ